MTMPVSKLPNLRFVALYITILYTSLKGIFTAPMVTASIIESTNAMANTSISTLKNACLGLKALIESVFLLIILK